MTGYRITVRSLEARQVSDQVLKVMEGLDECAACSEGDLHEHGAAGKLVFVLEDEDELLGARRPALK